MPLPSTLPWLLTLLQWLPPMPLLLRLLMQLLTLLLLQPTLQALRLMPLPPLLMRPPQPSKLAWARPSGRLGLERPPLRRRPFF